jgi:diguanylate cyclase
VLAPVGVNLAPVDRTPLRWLFAFGGLVGLTLLQAYDGGVSSPSAVLLGMGMIWFGVMASVRELQAGIAVMAACCFAPMLLVGAPAYPVAVAQASVLLLVTTSIALSLAALNLETGRLTAQLRRDATHDQLTGLLNRRGWEDTTEEALAEVGVDRAVSLVLLDLDRLKEVNDQLGHDEGDRTLAGTAERLRETFADAAAVSRLGGDEFAVLLVGRTADEVYGLVETLRSATPERGAFSAGIAQAGPHERLGGAMRRADLALYEAKTTGRGRACLAERPVALPEG